MENKINDMTSELKLEELDALNYMDEINPPNLNDWEKTDEERIDKMKLKMSYRESEINDIVSQMASKFDISHAKTYLQVKAIVKLKLIEKELYKEVMLQKDLKDTAKTKNNFKTISEEHRKYSTLISKLIGTVYIEEKRKDVVPEITRDELWGTNRWIVVD